jgi:hypothetical protein
VGELGGVGNGDVVALADAQNRSGDRVELRLAACSDVFLHRAPQFARSGLLESAQGAFVDLRAFRAGHGEYFALAALVHISGSIYPAGQEDWYAIGSASAKVTLGRIYNHDLSTHPESFDVYVDGSLTPAVPNVMSLSCYSAPAGSHYYEIKVHDTFATTYGPIIGYTSGTC